MAACPYCCEAVHDAATACRHCGRDFHLFKPLQARIEALEAQVAGYAAAQARVAELEAELARHRAAATPDEPPAAGVSAPTRRYATSVLLAVVPALALLLAAHVVLFFIYDVKPLYLRIASVLIPLPFAFALLVWHPRRFASSVLAGCALAGLAVSGMLAITAGVDGVPFLPQDLRDVREVLEYMASIALAFVTGLLLGRWRYRRVTGRPNRLVLFLVQLFTVRDEGELAVMRVANRVQKLVNSLTPVATMAASLYAGMKAVIGDG